MAKFKIGDKVNVEYSPNCFIKCKVLKVFHKHYDLQVLEDDKGLSKGDRFTFFEGYITPINQSKRDATAVNNDSIVIKVTYSAIKEFKTKEKAQEFIKQLANLLGADAL